MRCVEYYKECWKNRNETLHDEIKQRNRLKKWFENVKRRAESSECRQLKLCAERFKIDVNRCNCDNIKRWIMNLKQIEKKIEKIPVNDIRRFMLI